MVFEQEVNIYDNSAIRNRFNTLQTQFNIQQGKISALISDEELSQYGDHNTVTSRLSSLIQDVTGIHAQFSEMSTDFDHLSERYVAVESRVTTVEAGVDGLRASVSNVSEKTDQNTTNIAALDIRATGISSTVSNLVTELHNDYPTTRYAQSLIDQSADAITLSVQNQLASVNSRLDTAEFKITPSQIMSTVQAFVPSKTGDPVSMQSYIMQQADSIRLKAARISWTSDYSSMSETGLLKLTTSQFEQSFGVKSIKYVSASTVEGASFNISTLSGSAIEIKPITSMSNPPMYTIGIAKYASYYYVSEYMEYDASQNNLEYASPHQSNRTICVRKLGDSSYKFYNTYQYVNGVREACYIDNHGTKSLGHVFIHTDSTFGYSDSKAIVENDIGSGVAYTKDSIRNSFITKIAEHPNSPYQNVAGHTLELYSHKNGYRAFRVQLCNTNTSSTWHTFEMRLNNNTATLKFDDRNIQIASSSSMRYKHGVSVLIDEQLKPERLYRLTPKQFVFNDAVPLQYADMKGKTLPGFIAEDVAEIYPSAVIRDEEGRVDSWDERRIIPAMLALIQEQNERIKALEATLN